MVGHIKNQNLSSKGMVNKFFIGSKALHSSINSSSSSYNQGLDVRCDSINFYINNSYVRLLHNYGSHKATHIEATNSIIRFANSLSINNSSFTNCILWCYNSAGYLSSSNYAYYCVAINTPDMFEYIVAAYGTEVGITNKTVSNFSDIFKTFTGSNDSEFEDYKLTSAAASTYLGDNGTQVGIYGGSMPFNPMVNNPFITKCTVAEKSTPQGKLSVDIEVRPAQ